MSSINSVKTKCLAFSAVILTVMVFCCLSDCHAELRATFFDVGAADCILIEADGESMLVDTGFAKTWPRVKAALTDRGVSRIDYLVATHPHLDHIGAIPNLLEDFNVERAILPPIEYGTKAHLNMMDAISAAGLKTVYSKPGDRFSLGAAEIVVYGPYPMAYDNPNDWSVVLMVNYAGRSILLTGDAEAAAEADMLLNSEALPLAADVLKVAHHGSDSSSTYAFIEAVRPRYAIVSCDSTQDAEYPSVETAMTLYECGVEEVFTTEKYGDVTVIISEDGEITIRTEKQPG